MIPVRAYWRLLNRYLRPLRARVILLAVLLFTGIGLRVLNPQLIARFLDRAQEGAGLAELLQLAAWFMVLAVLYQGLSVGATYFAEQVAPPTSPSRSGGPPPTRCAPGSPNICSTWTCRSTRRRRLAS